VIRHIGLSNVSVDQFRTAREIVEIAAVTAHYNMGDRTGADLLQAAEAAGVAFSPWHPTTIADQSGNAMHLRAVLDPICERHNATIPQVGLAWLLRRSPLMLPIPGTANLSHLEANLNAAAIDLGTDEVDDITRLSTEPSDAPPTHEAD
jgi:pyridoxine 4-dehydrogenase